MGKAIVEAGVGQPGVEQADVGGLECSDWSG